MTKIKLNDEYNVFAQKYIEAWDEFIGIESQVLELEKKDIGVPESLKNEIYRYKLTIGTFAMYGKNHFNKNHKEIYKDGWDFWFKEDAELREKNYGSK